jgi:hypothetical protein
MSAKTGRFLLFVCALFAFTSVAYAGVGAKIETKEEPKGQFNLYLIAWNSDWLPAEGRDCYVDVKTRTRLGNGTWTEWENKHFTFHDGGSAKSPLNVLLGPAATTQAEVLGYGFK